MRSIAQVCGEFRGFEDFCASDSPCGAAYGSEVLLLVRKEACQEANVMKLPLK